MLVLNRSKYDAIFIGDDIKIVIFEHDRNRVRIGIEAPKKLGIVRGFFDSLTNSCVKESSSQKPSLISKWFGGNKE